MGDKTFKEYEDCIRGILTPMTVQPAALAPDFHTRQAKAVVFDIYGTLFTTSIGHVGVESEEGGNDALRKALHAGGWLDFSQGELTFPSGIVEEAIRSERALMVADGIPFPEVDIRMIWLNVLYLIGLYEDNAYDVLDARLRHRINLTALSYECRINPVWPMPNLATILNELKGRDVLLGIVSNAQFYTPLLIEILMERSLFVLGFHPDLRVWSYQEGEGKPSPVLFSEMNRRLAHVGIRPEQVLYVGNDMVKDILPAHKAGWRTVLFAGDERSLRLHNILPDRSRGVPDMIINDLFQLVQALA